MPGRCGRDRHSYRACMTDFDLAADRHAFEARLSDVQSRIDDACRRAGRDPSEVTLVAVTKTFPLDAVRAARRAGVRDFGENKAQELAEKAEALPGVVGGGDVCWHMIGHLQRNKAKDVVASADLFHALDSPRLARELQKRAAQAGRVLPCLVQVNVSGEESKYGLDPEALYPFLDGLAEHDHLYVRGLMTLAAPTDDPEDVRPQFRRLRALRDGYAGNPRVELAWLSMGMSGDYEVAVEEGATHVRVGSALFGPRDYD